MMIARIVSLSFVLVFAHNGLAQSPFVVRDNNQALEDLSNERSLEARDKLLEALARDPFELRVRMNLGLVFEANKEHEKALKEYLSVVRASQDPELQFYALFNAARAAGQLQDIPKALELYQRALDLKPDSVEVKTNIELLWKDGQGQGKGGGGQSGNQQDKQNGQGQGDQEQEKKDQQGQQPQDQNNQGQENQDQKKQPKPFDSKDLSQDDVRKILEEITSQEQKIRAKEYGKEVKEKPRDKDW